MQNRFLEDDSFAPVRREHTAESLVVTGNIPHHLDGRYLRNGPNPVSELDPAAYHWFTGDAMVHGVRIRDGRAEWYRNRWIRNSRISELLGEPARPGGHRGTPNTNVLTHAGRTLALVEAGTMPVELDEELNTIGSCDFDGTVTGGYTAHPKLDPVTGELHAVSYSFVRGNRVRYTVIGADGRARRSVEVEVTGSPMMHDFSLTEKYVVFYDLPVTFDIRQAVPASVPLRMRLPARLMLSALIGQIRVPSPIRARIGKRMQGRVSKQPGGNGVLPYRWNRRYPARVGVMPREGGNSDVRWFDVEPSYVFHPMNAYDDGDTVVLDLVRYRKMFDTDFTGPGEDPATLDRWIVDLASGRVREERLDDRPQEFPRIDERLTGRRHRFGYTLQMNEGDHPDHQLLKQDLVNCTTSTHAFGPGKYASEFVFVPNSTDAIEDDGVLMGFVYDQATGNSDLRLLDAATLEPMAAIHLPDRVPAGFHGNWNPTA